THDLDAEVWASPLVADGKVYFASRRGTVWCFADSPEMTILSQVKLGEPIHASPIAANGVLYLATMTRLYAIQEAAQGKPLAP
ncbi:MAG: PQQ-binding-like beta-propeller repeat protein, partial [Verrucomicrobia bacterium]|nr:PQQ-binding-like beta-propeller repeat protein [Verrucomicrobiota bacterium]